MLTTGSKWFLGLGTFALVLAAAYGWVTGGTGLGPLTMGYYGAVGDHFGYALLVSLALLALLLGLVQLGVRDADPAALAQLAGTDGPPAELPPAHLAYWPLAGAFGLALVLLGLVVSNVLFVAGFIVLLAVTVEWMVLAWSDHATGDPATNKIVRDRVLGPYEIPIAGVLIAGVTVASLSRVFLTTTKLGAVGAGTVVATLILLIGILLATRPRISANVVAGLLVVAAAGVVTAGVIGAARGEREIGHEHEAPAGEHGEAPAEGGEEHVTETGNHPLVPEGTERATITTEEEG
jgi:hypothetical protein